MNEAILLCGGVILGSGITYFIMLRRQNNDRDNLQRISEQIFEATKDKLGAEKEVIRVDMEGKKDAIKSLVDEIRRELTKADERLRKSDEERIASFSSLKRELETHKQLTNDLRGSTDELKNILSNNQLRGAFGERIAEDLLKMAGFVINQDYFAQAGGADGRPDFTILLPDQTKINVDVKFPYSNLQKYVEAKDDNDRKRYFAEFTRDVREKIKQIASRGYISPLDNTVDFAIAFIPNEMIFSYIYEHSNDIWEEAMSKKVVLAGPYSFVALLRLIKQAHSNFKLQSNIHGIIQLVQKFRSEYEKFSEELDVLGSRIDSASKQFQNVSVTRSRQLGRVVDQIESRNVLADEDPTKQLEN